MVYDSISYMLAQLKLASKQRRLQISVQNTKINRALLLMLQKLGYINGFSLVAGINKILIFLKYSEIGVPAIRGIHRVSCPGARVYAPYSVLKTFSRSSNLNNTYQIIVLSTPSGLMTHNSAINKRVGGEVLFTIS